MRDEGLDRDRVVVWTREHEAVYNTRTGATLADRSKENPTRNIDLAFSGGIQVGTCWTNRAHKVVTGICANGVLSGRKLWTYWYPGRDEEYILSTSVSVVVADGRVYSLSSDHNGQTADHLTINDTHTGAPLARIPLTLSSNDALFQLDGAGHGLVSIHNTRPPTEPAATDTVLLGDK